MAKPQISASVALIRDYWTNRRMSLVDIRLRMNIFSGGKFEIVRVDETGRFTFSPIEEGIATIDDPACKEPGVYYLRPDTLGQFHQETTMADALIKVESRCRMLGYFDYEFVTAEEENTFKIRVLRVGQFKEFFAETFAKLPGCQIHLSATPIPVSTAP